MSVGLPSDEVAEDYKNSLEDLTLNSRYEISNLTVIAKENTEHALAISRVLEKHIGSTPPDRKLPALYVLDSVVKNIGTPYTLFLGRNLYSIFMNAYTLVNPGVRKKLDEMLQTWQQPVPGSKDTRPVFPRETTQPITTALLKARTRAIQEQQQQQARTQREMMARQRTMPVPNAQWRNTPTPPQVNGQHYPPPQQGPSQYNVPNGHFQQRPPYPPYAQYPPPQQVPQPHQQPYQQIVSHPQNLQGLQKPLEIRIGELVRTAKERLAANVHDQALTVRLQALVALQTLMSRQTLSPDELLMVENQLDALSAPPTQATFASPSMPGPHAFQPQYALPSQQRPQQGPLPPNPGLQDSVDSKNLADIIARAQRTPGPPQTPQASPQPQPTLTSHPSGQSAPVDLLASLRAKGLLPADSSTPVNDPAVYPPPSSVTNTPPVPPPGHQRSPSINDIELTSASLKRPRPYLISILYEARPNQCSTCGRRFLATEDGKQKKARHLDWHFRTNQRLADSAKRGQSRSWYVDELEWITSRDDPEDAPPTDASSAATKAALAASLAAADPKNKHIPVPSDSVLQNQPCPICQEKFETTWNDEAEMFVWRDAIQIGSRVYHASCHSEVKKDGGNTPGRTNTPDSVLGKRKAAADMNATQPTRIKA